MDSKKLSKPEIVKFLKDLYDWQLKTFPKSTPASMVTHLREEVVELLADLHTDPRGKATRYEFADCFILLFGAAMRFGLSLDDIIAIMMDKFNIVQRREWGKPDENKVYHHIKPKL
jgi:hypothetical protein